MASHAGRRCFQETHRDACTCAYVRTPPGVATGYYQAVPDSVSSQTDPFLAHWINNVARTEMPWNTSPQVCSASGTDNGWATSIADNEAKQKTKIKKEIKKSKKDKNKKSDNSFHTTDTVAVLDANLKENQSLPQTKSETSGKPSKKSKKKMINEPVDLKLPGADSLPEGAFAVADFKMKLKDKISGESQGETSERTMVDEGQQTTETLHRLNSSPDSNNKVKDKKKRLSKHGDDISVESGEGSGERKSSQQRRNCCLPMQEVCLAISFGAVAIATFDVVSDIVMLTEFVALEMGPITYTLMTIVFISSLIYMLEVYLFVAEVVLYCTCCPCIKTQEGRDNLDRKVTLMNEIITYLLLVFEDLPINLVILFLALGHGDPSCKIYNRVFQETYVAKIALLAAIVSASWRGLQSLRYCVCFNWIEELSGRVGNRSCCCIRLLRPIIAVIVCFCAFYIFLMYGGSDSPNNCVIPGGNATNTIATNHTYRNTSQ